MVQTNNDLSIKSKIELDKYSNPFKLSFDNLYTQMFNIEPIYIESNDSMYNLEIDINF